MGYFRDSAHVADLLGGFFRAVTNDADMGPKLLASKLVLRFHYANPDANLTVDLRGAQAVITPNDTSVPADVEMWMDAEIAHKYWLGQVSLPIALARRQIKAKGPIPKILKLLPILSKAHALYPAYVTSHV